MRYDPANAPFVVANWPAPPKVRAITTLRRGINVGVSNPPFDSFNFGDRCGDDETAVASNRAQLTRILNLQAAPRWLRQVHGTDVHSFDLLASDASESATADAAVSSHAGTALAILSADCLPVLFCADDGSQIAAAHAGWRGLANGVLEATVATMHCPADRLLAWMGPAAGPRAYEVGAEVFAAFTDRDFAASSAFQLTRPDHWLCDLYSLARQRLAAIGVTRVFGGEHCTISDPVHFFSHRRDGQSGRMASLIWIKQ